ncbi:MAG: DUF4271 domain-containing protein [Verrucomicrobia bacterium]|nr:DUF4271 domain-containing protein [Cytophagales bacterium]
MKKFGYSRRMFLLLLGFLTFPTFAQTIEETTIYDFSDDWLIYSSKYKTYIPVSVGNTPTVNALSVWFPLKSFNRYTLSIKTSQTLFFFINGRLQGTLQKDQVRKLNVDSLRKIFLAENIFLTFHTDNKQIIPPQIRVIHQAFSSQNQKKNLSEPALLVLEKRKETDFQNFSILVFVGLMAVFALLWNLNPKSFSQYYYWKYVLTSTSKDISQRVVFRTDVLFLLNHSFLLAFGLALFRQSTSSEVNATFFSNSVLFSRLFSTLLVETSIVFLAILCKYLLIAGLGTLLKAEKLTPIHFYRHFSLSTFFYTPIVIFLFTATLVLPAWLPELIRILPWIALVFQIVRTLFITVHLNTLLPFRNVYLFSYLCTTELLPILGSLRYFNQLLPLQ